MKDIYTNPNSSILKNLAALTAAIVLFFQCQEETISTYVKNGKDDSFPPRAIDEPESFGNSSSLSKIGAIEAKNIESMYQLRSSSRTEGPTTYIHFGDEFSCLWNANICANTFVTWPGYIQNTAYGEWGYAWMSQGPGSSFISNGTRDHYHIIGLSMPDIEPNPKHTAMFGDDWLAYYMQRSGHGRINFDLTEIKVKGTVPITLYFKTASGGWMYWPSIGPGWWHLPGATNIQEFHIRAASALPEDKYSIDDIQVKGR